MVLKVPVSWVWILGACVLIAGVSLSYFGQRGAETGPGKYKIGTCLRNESLGLISQVLRVEDAEYVLKIIASKKFPQADHYRLHSEQRRPVGEVDSNSAERPVPCPKEEESSSRN